MLTTEPHSSKLPLQMASVDGRPRPQQSFSELRQLEMDNPSMWPEGFVRGSTVQIRTHTCQVRREIGNLNQLNHQCGKNLPGPQGWITEAKASLWGQTNIGLSFFTTLDFSHIPVMVEGKRKIEGKHVLVLDGQNLKEAPKKPKRYIYPSNSSLVLTRIWLFYIFLSFYFYINVFSAVFGKQSANANARCGCFQRKNWCVSRSPGAADSGAACIMKELRVLGGSSHLVSGL